MAKNKVDINGINTSKLRVLTYEEMIDLFNKYKSGDKNAKDILVEGNLKLVLSILRKYQNKCDNLDDLFQIGVVGLIKAINNFDLSFGVKFSTYAVLMIEGEIKRYIRDNSSIRISRSIKELSYQIISYRENEPIYNDNGDAIYLIDQIEDKNINDLDNLLSLREALSKIKDRERIILLSRYIDGMSQSEIAENLNISKAQVSRIENSALNSIKKLIL